MIYLDNAASMPVLPAAQKAFSMAEQKYFNSAAAYGPAVALHDQINVLRNMLLQMAAAEKRYRVIFTSSATESNNLFIKGLFLDPAQILESPKKKSRVHVCLAEHPSLVEPLRYLESCEFVEISDIPLNNSGRIDLDFLQQSLNDNSKLVILSQINNHHGVINPVKEICQLIRKYNLRIYIHIDGSQAWGKIPVNLTAWDCDSYVISGHKIGATKGVAALVLRNEVKITPLFHGGGHEYNLRSSTVNYSAIESLVAASQVWRNQSMMAAQDFKKQLVLALQRFLPEIEFPFGTNDDDLSPYILTSIVPRITTDVLVRLLSEDEIYIAGSSACSSKDKKSDTITRALHISEAKKKSLLRLSWSFDCQPEMIEFFCEKLVYHCNSLKQL